MLGATCVECPAHKATLSTAQQMQHLVQIIIRTGFLSYKNSASNCCSFTNDMHAALRLSREAFRRSKSAPVSFPIRISDIAAESTALCIAALSCKGGMISSVCRGKRRPHLVIEGVARHNLGTECKTVRLPPQCSSRSNRLCQRIHLQSHACHAGDYMAMHACICAWRRRHAGMRHARCGGTSRHQQPLRPGFAARFPRAAPASRSRRCGALRGVAASTTTTCCQFQLLIGKQGIRATQQQKANHGK